MAGEIGIRLQLLADFAKVASRAKTDLTKIVEGFDAINEAASGFKATNIAEMVEAVNGLKSASAGAKVEVGALATQVGRLATNSEKAVASTKRLLEDITGIGTAGTKAAAGIENIANATENIRVKATRAGAATKSAIDDIAKSAQAADAMIYRLTNSMTHLGNEAVIVDRLGHAFIGLESDAFRAASAIRDVEMQILRLPTTKHIAIQVSMNRLPMIPSVPVSPTGYGPSYRPMITGGSGSSQKSLPPWVTNKDYDIQPYGQPNNPGQKALPPGWTAYASGPNRTWKSSYRPQQDQTIDWNTGPPYPGQLALSGGGGSGPPRPPYNPIGTRISETGKNIGRTGDNLQGAGWGGAMNALLVGSVAMPVLSNAANNIDIENMIKETLAHKGASGASSNAFIKDAISSMTSVGGDFQSNLGGLVNFISGTPLGSVNFNDPKQSKMMVDAYKKIVETTLVDNATGGGNTSTGSMALNALATAKNFGFNMNDTKSVSEGIDFATNYLVQMKNKTASTGDQAAMAVRNLGPIEAMQGIKPEDIAGVMAILSQNKILGGQAGNQAKRILTRQASDPAALRKLQAEVSKLSGGEFNLSEYDKNGKAGSPLDMVAQIAAFEQKYHISDKNKASINATMGGLYAIPALGTLTEFATQTKGTNGKPPTQEEMKAHLHKFSHDMMYGHPAGSLPGEKPRETTTRIRTDQNPKQEVKKTSGIFDAAMMTEVKQLTPEFIKILHAINGMITSFEQLAPWQKSFIENFILWGAVASGVVGVTGILVGNFLKMGGALIGIGGRFASLIEIMMGVEVGSTKIKLLDGIISKITGIIPKAGTAIMEAFGIVAPRAMAIFGASFLGIPILGWIAGLVLAGITLYQAWTNDWGGIREKVGGVITWLGDEFHNVGTWFGNAVHSGEAFASQFISGLTSKFTGGVNAVKAAIKKIGDLFPHSPPADSSSPLAGAPHAGETFATDVVDGMLSAFLAGAPKVKKATKGLSDAVIFMKNESITAVQDMALKIEAILAASGSKINKRWIDLVNPTTGEKTRVKGDTSAYQKAATMMRGHDNTMTDARAYLNSWIGPLMANNTFQSKLPSIINMLVTKLRSMEHGEPQSIKNQIETAIRGLELSVDKIRSGQYGRIDTQGRTIAAGIGSIAPKEEAYSRIKQEYEDKLSDQQRVAGGDPTKNQLTAQLETERTERRELSEIIQDETDKIAKLNTQIAAMEKAMSAAGGGTDKEKEALAGFKTELASANSTLLTHTADITKLSTDIDAYVVKINNAKVALTGFAKVLDDAFTEASKSAGKFVSGDVGKGLDTIVGRMLGSRTPKVNSSIFTGAMTSFVGSFVKSMVGSTLDNMFGTGENGIASFLNKLLGGNSSSPLGIIAGSTTNNPGKKGSRLTGGDADTNAPTGTTQDPVTVSVTSQTSSVDLGQNISDDLDGLTTISKASSTSAGNGMVSLTNDTVPSLLKTSAGVRTGAQNTQSIVSALGGGAEAVMGLTQGDSGIAAGLQTYSGISSLFSGIASSTAGPGGNAVSSGLGNAGPYVAAAAAIYSIFAAGAPSRNPANQPDQNEPGYGSFLANYLGNVESTPGGGISQPSTQYSLAAGNTSLEDQLSAYINAPGSTAGLNSEQLSEVNQLKSLSGGSATGLGITAEHNDTFSLESGQQVNVETFQQLVTEVTTMMSTFQNNMTQAAENANALAASFTMQQIGAPAGFQMINGVNGAASGFLPGGSSQVAPQSVSPNVTVNVSVLEGASISGASADDIATAVQQQIPAITQAVNMGNYQNSRVTGNYTSQTF